MGDSGFTLGSAGKLKLSEGTKLTAKLAFCILLYTVPLYNVSCNMLNKHVGLCLVDDAEGDAHQFLLVAAFLLTSGQSAD